MDNKRVNRQTKWSNQFSSSGWSKFISMLNILSFLSHFIYTRHSKVFLRHTHVKDHPLCSDYLRATDQERYTILNLHSLLRSIESNCVLCRMFPAANIPHIMADLPVERLAYKSPPFTNTGFNYFGPFYVTLHRTTEKRWSFVFTF